MVRDRIHTRVEDQGHAGCDIDKSDYTAVVLRRVLFFFFQAEDGIRDYKVTGVQTCALPIWRVIGVHLGSGQRVTSKRSHQRVEQLIAAVDPACHRGAVDLDAIAGVNAALPRSEERSVGKECRSRWSPYH